MLSIEQIIVREDRHHKRDDARENPPLSTDVSSSVKLFSEKASGDNVLEVDTGRSNVPQESPRTVSSKIEHGYRSVPSGKEETSPIKSKVWNYDTSSPIRELTTFQPFIFKFKIAKKFLILARQGFSWLGGLSCSPRSKR